ncbi:TlpA disulfide reductase family protein [Pedobacter aquatilis]|uniref:TlpA family protein disulfide reductase n=1 Tax=Pedobacter aquatilis TaxID=351343 RepID=UPI0025B37798|nr:TlpA disulfide reductase family protein [Pedobacter aquatilis]MDN3586042.1 TlpA disulfide reductase family protein [Pedobacter aquatilis]
MKRFIMMLGVILRTNGLLAQQDLSPHYQKNLESIILSVSLKPNSQITFRYFEDYYREISYRNPGKRDSIISKRLNVKNPTLLEYNSMLMDPAGPVERSYPLLLVPGDTVMLKTGMNAGILIQSSTGLEQFADSIIYFPKSYHWSYDEDAKFLKTEGVNKMVEKIDDRFEKNEASIKNTGYDYAHLAALKYLNANIKYISISKLLSDKHLTFSKLTDSLYKDLYNHAGEINSVSTVNNLQTSNSIIRYNSVRQNQELANSDIWSWIVGADIQLKQTDFYRNYLTFLLAQTFKQLPADLPKLTQALDLIKEEVPAIDTLFQVSNILKETYIDFPTARKRLRSFANGRYSFIIDSDEKSANRELKNIKNLSAVVLTDFSGNKTDFKSLITNGKARLTVIDFWASWCIPCIAEIPFMKIVEQKLKGKPVRFMAVSIDQNNEVGKWIEAAKKNQIFKQPFQYRLADFKKSALTQLINLQTIPRYVVIDYLGNILTDDFLRPSNPQFEIRLNKFLANLTDRKQTIK